MIEKAIFASLKNDAALAALVSALPGGNVGAPRIFPLRTPEVAPPPDPQGTYPAISFFMVDCPRPMTLSGPSGIAQPRIQIDSWANKYDDAKKVAAAVRKVLHGFAGVVATEDGPVNILSSFQVSERDFYEPLTKVNHVASDFMISHRE